MQQKKILAISGSTRVNSTNETILKTIASLQPERLQVEIYTRTAELPHFNPDLDNDNVAIQIKELREKISQSDGVIICTPEYVFSLPGALKNAIEWMVSTTVFSDKPAALIVASGLGDKAYESLNLIMNTLGAKIGPSTNLLIRGARSKFKPQAIDDATLQGLKKLTTSFINVLDGNN